MDVKLIILSDYEKKTNRTLGENKPKQSQSQIRGQRAEDRWQNLTTVQKTGLLCVVPTKKRCFLRSIW